MRMVLTFVAGVMLALAWHVGEKGNIQVVEQCSGGFGTVDPVTAYDAGQGTKLFETWDRLYTHGHKGTM